MMERKVSRQKLGSLGESLAASRLQARGYYIVERNFRCPYGEIDLVAEEGEDLVFVEVKTRRGTAYGLPEEAVDWRKQRKLIQVAYYYLNQYSCSERSWRIDVVAIEMNSGQPVDIRIYKHAVTEG
ncbi:YraN family protein [Ktedonospora formicarum]|nr:YraN family protein [Ktedonospora formicarum]